MCPPLYVYIRSSICSYALLCVYTLSTYESVCVYVKLCMCLWHMCEWEREDIKEQHRIEVLTSKIGIKSHHFLSALYSLLPYLPLVLTSGAQVGAAFWKIQLSISCDEVEQHSWPLLVVREAPRVAGYVRYVLYKKIYKIVSPVGHRCCDVICEQYTTDSYYMDAYLGLGH